MTIWKTCKVCGEKKATPNHITSAHDITYDEYKEEYINTTTDDIDEVEDTEAEPDDEEAENTTVNAWQQF